MMPVSESTHFVYWFNDYRLLDSNQHTKKSSALVLVTRGDLPLLVSHSRSTAARRGVKVAHPVARNLAAFVVAERKRDAVGALELDFLSSEDEILRTRRGSSRDGGRFGIDVDENRVGDVVDGGGVRGRECRLASDERRYNALEECFGVDEGDAAKG